MRSDSQLTTLKILESVPLTRFSSYRIGGPARYFCEAGNAEEIRSAVTFAREQGVPLFVMGGGTNLLISDEGFRGLVVKMSLATLEARGETIEVGAGVPVADVLNFAIRQGLAGLEWAGGLPGTVGGAVRGNAGAFKGEIKDRIAWVESFDTETLGTIRRENRECGFGYRSSLFKERGGREIILSTTLEMEKGDEAKIGALIQEKINYRRHRHPMDYPNIGSIFKNVDLKLVPERLRDFVAKVVKVDPFPVVPTAFFISEAGLRGLRRGDAMVSPKHPNFIVNLGGAAAADVRSLIETVKQNVYDKFTVRLEEEIQNV